MNMKTIDISGGRLCDHLYLVENKEVLSLKRGEIYYADLSPVIGSEQGGLRPVLIIQNDIGNRHSPTTIVAAITSKKEKGEMPTHVKIQVDGLSKQSLVLLEQVRTIDRSRVKERIAMLDEDIMTQVDKALKVSIALE